jgi:ElaB/YqjD/DUF883 family membrane-anchored ribosome-binding protein
MAEEPEVIRHQMEETRAALTEKLEALEEKVVGTVEGATSAVNETVSTIKEATQETVGTVKETVQETVNTVRETFDIELQFQRHPFVILGGSVALGYLAGCLIERRREEPRFAPLAAAPQTNGLHPVAAAAPAPVETKETWLGSVGEALKPELGKLKGLAIGTLMSLLRDTVTRSLSEEVSGQVREVIDDMTERLGGRPLHEPIVKEEKNGRKESMPPPPPDWARARG